VGLAVPQSPGEKTTETESTGLTRPRPHCSSAGVSCPLQPLTWLPRAEQQGSMAPGWVWAGPRVEPCSCPHSGAGSLLDPQAMSQDSTLLQNGLQLCYTKPSRHKACGDHPQPTEGLVFSLHKSPIVAGPCFTLWDHTPAPLLQCSLLIIVMQLEFVSFKHRGFEHPLSRAQISQYALPNRRCPTAV